MTLDVLNKMSEELAPLPADLRGIMQFADQVGPVVLATYHEEALEAVRRHFKAKSTRRQALYAVDSFRQALIAMKKAMKNAA